MKKKLKDLTIKDVVEICKKELCSTCIIKEFCPTIRGSIFEYTNTLILEKEIEVEDEKVEVEENEQTK